MKGSQALSRAKSQTIADENREASCQRTTSLYNSRLPLNQSFKCILNLQVCSCDEYPFASTWNGGSIDPARTSLKRISATHNSESGRPLAKDFYLKERLLDFTIYPATVSGGGDEFWVHIK